MHTSKLVNSNTSSNKQIFDLPQIWSMLRNLAKQNMELWKMKEQLKSQNINKSAVRYNSSIKIQLQQYLAQQSLNHIK